MSASRDLCPDELFGLGTGGAGERDGATAEVGNRRGPVGKIAFRGAIGGAMFGFGGEFAGGIFLPPTYSDKLRNGGWPL